MLLFRRIWFRNVTPKSCIAFMKILLHIQFLFQIIKRIYRWNRNEEIRYTSDVFTSIEFRYIEVNIQFFNNPNFFFFWESKQGTIGFFLSEGSWHGHQKKVFFIGNKKNKYNFSFSRSVIKIPIKILEDLQLNTRILWT